MWLVVVSQVMRDDLNLISVLQEDAEATKLKEQRLAEYAAKKAKSTFLNLSHTVIT